jgi:transcriptional regulator of acetoin/glycerol metabolism
VILSNNGRITLSELPPEVTRPAAMVQAPVALGVPAVTVSTGGDSSMPPPIAPQAPGSLREVERQQILAALEKTGWHRGKTAEILGISPSTLYRRLRDYDLERRR